MLLNAMRGGDGSAGIGAPVPHPQCLFGKADNAELRGADSPRLSISYWGRLCPYGVGSWRKDSGKLEMAFLMALCKDRLLFQLAGPRTGRSRPFASHFGPVILILDSQPMEL